MKTNRGGVFSLNITNSRVEHWEFESNDASNTIKTEYRLSLNYSYIIWTIEMADAKLLRLKYYITKIYSDLNWLRAQISWKNQPVQVGIEFSLAFVLVSYHVLKRFVRSQPTDRICFNSCSEWEKKRMHTQFNIHQIIVCHQQWKEMLEQTFQQKNMYTWDTQQEFISNFSVGCEWNLRE